MASLNPENPFNPAIRCVSSSKFPVCTDRPLPICDVFGSVDVNSNLAIAQDTFERLTFSGTPVANNCVWDSTNNQFLIQKAGNYTVSYDVAVDGATVAVANSFIGVNAAASGAGCREEPARLGGALRPRRMGSRSDAWSWPSPRDSGSLQ